MRGFFLKGEIREGERIGTRKGVVCNPHSSLEDLTSSQGFDRRAVFL